MAKAKAEVDQRALSQYEETLGADAVSRVCTAFPSLKRLRPRPVPSPSGVFLELDPVVPEDVAAALQHASTNPQLALCASLDRHWRDAHHILMHDDAPPLPKLETPGATVADMY